MVMAAARGEGPVSQPSTSHPREPDPLLEFFEEVPARRPAEPSELSEKPRDTSRDPDLLRRVERAERQTERALIEITTLKSDMATLVSALDDIRKRMGRPPARPAPVVPIATARKLGWLRTVSAFLLR